MWNSRVKPILARWLSPLIVTVDKELFLSYDELVEMVAELELSKEGAGFQVEYEGVCGVCTVLRGVAVGAAITAVVIVGVLTW